MNGAYKESVKRNAEKPFTVVQNRRVNYARENQNNNKWNGYNEINDNRRYFGVQSRYYNGKGNNNGRWDYRKKQDTTVGSTSDGANRDEIHKSQIEKVVNPKGKSTENISKENDNCLEKSVGEESKKDEGKIIYNRFTLLNELVREEDLIPSAAQRMIVNEYMNKEKDVSDIGNQGWSKEMEKYYKDRKELFDAAKELEQDKDVECEIQLEEEFGMRNEESGGIRISLCRITICFQSVLGVVEEHSNGSSVPSNEMNQFAECIREIEMEDILSSGFYFTWTKNHSPIVPRLPNGMAKRKKAFRFSNFVTDKMEFLPIVKKAWEVEVECHMMYIVVKKMKYMKPFLIKLSWKNRNIFKRVTKLRDCLKEVQAEVDKQPHNEDIKAKSCKILSEYYAAMNDENNLMHKGMIMSICNEKGERFENDKVAKQFVKHFQEFLGKKDVILKIQGPNGYTARFYKSSWSVIGKDICKAVQDFFVNGKLLGEVNATLISLVPKVQNPDKSAFIARRQITDNILLAQELFKDVIGNKRSKKLLLRLIYKKHITLNWEFLRVVFEQFGFPDKMVKWIMVCVSTTKFSININGEKESYLSGGRGRRQGDPMSPYLSTLVMEAFNIIIRKNITDTKKFKYHQKCQKLGITHLCFADDLLVFCHGDNKSSSILDIVPFAIGRLPVRYLGVPLLKRLMLLINGMAIPMLCERRGELELGVKFVPNIDATNLERAMAPFLINYGKVQHLDYPKLEKLFDIILFMFPFDGKVFIKLHHGNQQKFREFLRKYFKVSATLATLATLLEEDGQIHVTMNTSMHYSLWRLEEMDELAGLKKRSSLWISARCTDQGTMWHKCEGRTQDA
ncbi:RNA-directed DNA polymerase, eukaryota, reverse transcriptase zinc-binding domain protein [Tanacetum coccineum]